MKNLFSLFAFTMVFLFSGKFSAQQITKDQSFTAQRADDGIIIAYPNPAKDFIYIKAKNSDLLLKQITFYSILGTEVASFSANANTVELTIDRLRPGKYLMKYVLNDGTQKVTQIIKQ